MTSVWSTGFRARLYGKGLAGGEGYVGIQTSHSWHLSGRQTGPVSSTRNVDGLQQFFQQFPQHNISFPFTEVMTILIRITSGMKYKSPHHYVPLFFTYVLAGLQEIAMISKVETLFCPYVFTCQPQEERK